MFRILSSALSLGNVNIGTNDEEDAKIEDMKALETACVCNN